MSQGSILLCLHGTDRVWMLQESSSCAWGAHTLEWRMQVGIFSAMCRWHLQLSKLLLCPQGCHSV